MSIVCTTRIQLLCDAFYFIVLFVTKLSFWKRNPKECLKDKNGCRGLGKPAHDVSCDKNILFKADKLNKNVKLSPSFV